MEEVNLYQSQTASGEYIPKSKEDLISRLHEYKDKVHHHLSLYDSSQNEIIDAISSVFYTIKKRFSLLLQDVDHHLETLGTIPNEDSDQLSTHLSQYHSSGLKGMISSYDELTPIDLYSILSQLHSKLNLSFQRTPEEPSEMIDDYELLNGSASDKEKQEKAHNEIIKNLQSEVEQLKDSLRAQEEAYNKSSQDLQYHQRLTKLKDEEEKKLQEIVQKQEIQYQELVARLKKFQDDYEILLKSKQQDDEIDQELELALENSPEDVVVDSLKTQDNIPDKLQDESDLIKATQSLESRYRDLEAKEKKTQDDYVNLAKLKLEGENKLHQTIRSLEAQIQDLDTQLLSKNSETFQLKSSIESLELHIKDLQDTYTTNIKLKEEDNKTLKMNLEDVERQSIHIFLQILQEEPSKLPKIYFPTLPNLHLGGNCIGAQGVEALARSDFPSLTILNLQSNSIGLDGVQALSRARFPKLKELNLQNNSLGVEGIEALSRCNFPNLAILNLENNNLEDAGMRALSHCNFPMLKVLNLQNNLIEAPGIESLAKSSLIHLTHLNLGYNNIGDEGVKMLVKSVLPCLLSLDLEYNTIAEIGIEALAACHFPTLKSLNLGGNNIGDSGMKAFTRVNFPELIELNLENNGIEAGGVKELTRCKFTHLENLYLFNNLIGYSGVVALAKCKFPCLKNLCLGGNSIGAAGIEVLRNVFSNANIE